MLREGKVHVEANCGHFIKPNPHKEENAERIPIGTELCIR